MTAAASARAQGGFSLVGAMAGIAIMLIMMGAAVPSWHYVMKNMREEELLFRGEQIAQAVERYQRKHGGAPPNSIEDLVKGKFLRKPWKDPMTRDGKWRLLQPGEVGPTGMRFRGRRGRDRGPGSELGGVMGAAGERGPGRLGGFVGVSSTSEDESYRIFNGQTKYTEWQFVAGQPRVVGRQRTFGVPLPAPNAPAPHAPGTSPPGPTAPPPPPKL